MYCRHCGVELLDWAKVCIMCGAPTDDASPDPVVIEDVDQATTVLSSHAADADNAATRVVSRSRGARINISAPNPSASNAPEAAQGFQEEDRKSTL